MDKTLDELKEWLGNNLTIRVDKVGDKGGYRNDYGIKVEILLDDITISEDFTSLE